MIACIDVGSNSIKYRSYALLPQKNELKLNYYKRFPLRLGTEAFQKKEIQPKTIKKILKVFKEISDHALEEKIEEIYAVGTSALRTVNNSSWIKKKIKKKTGIKLKILSGKEEAELLRYVDCKNYKKSNSLLVDIGGGSTEIFYIDEKGKEHMESFNLGAVRLYDKRDKKASWLKLQNWLANVPNKNIKNIIGIGSNARSIVKINNKEYLSRKELCKTYMTLSSMSTGEKINSFSLSDDRADIIEYAALIFMEILKRFDSANLYSSTWNLSDGMIKQCLDFKNFNQKIFQSAH
ncbi:MAG: hypothetical protein ACJZ18_03475 [Methylophilaceae bacterium]